MVFVEGGARGGRVMEAIMEGGGGWTGELAGTGRMEFWEISGDLGRPLQVLFFPPIPPNHNKAASLVGINKLMLLQFARTRTHAPVGYDCAHAVRRKNTRTRRFDTSMACSHGCGQCIPTIYNAQTLSCAYYFWCMTVAIVWESVSWNQLGRVSRCYFLFFAFLSNRISDQICSVGFDYCALLFFFLQKLQKKPTISNIFFFLWFPKIKIIQCEKTFKTFVGKGTERHCVPKNHKGRAFFMQYFSKYV